MDEEKKLFYEFVRLETATVRLKESIQKAIWKSPEKLEELEFQKKILLDKWLEFMKRIAIARFPDFDSNFTDEQKIKWFDGFKELVDQILKKEEIQILGAG